MEERKGLFRALVGSHNYNMNTASSDKDYKVFVIPTFNDLYDGKQYSQSIIGDTVDLDYHDIRKLPSLWWKANVNFLEVLFSNEILIGSEISTTSKDILESILRSKDRIAKMNLPYLYNACIGMHITKKKQITKGTSGTQSLVAKFGYDTKQAMHSYRILDFLVRFAETEFNDFKKSIEYTNEDKARQLLMDIKTGKYSIEEVNSLLDIKIKQVESQYNNVYINQTIDTELKNDLVSAIKRIVKLEISK